MTRKLNKSSLKNFTFIFQKHYSTPSKNSLEIERKFWYDFDIEKRLAKIGANKIEQKHIRDKYYDSSINYFLLLNEYYLRSRAKNNSKTNWELKYPSNLVKNIENYYEVEEPTQIGGLVYDLSRKYADFNQINKSSCMTINELLTSFDLKCFADINTTRKSYVVNNVRIDLDETDFGYKLGELEFMLPEKASLANLNLSLESISDLTKKLGKFKV